MAFLPTFFGDDGIDRAALFFGRPSGDTRHQLIKGLVLSRRHSGPDRADFLRIVDEGWFLVPHNR